MSRGGAEHAEKIVKNEHGNWSSAVTAAPRDQVFQLSNFFRASLGNFRCRRPFIRVSIGCAKLKHPERSGASAFPACQVSPNSLKNQYCESLWAALPGRAAARCPPRAPANSKLDHTVFEIANSSSFISGRMSPNNAVLR